MRLLDQVQNAIYTRLRAGPWRSVTYECGLRATGEAMAQPGSLLVHPEGQEFEVSDRCDIGAELSAMRFEAIVDFACFASADDVAHEWQLDPLKVQDGEFNFYVIYLRSVRIEEGPENGGSTRLTLSFQTLKL